MSIKIVHLNVEPFNQCLDVFINIKTESDINKINTYINEQYKPIQDIEIGDDIFTTAGCFYYFPCKKYIYRCIFLKEFNLKNIDDYSNFIHELYHALYDIINQVEVQTKDKYNELMAYLLDCNLNNFLKAIKEKIYEKI